MARDLSECRLCGDPMHPKQLVNHSRVEHPEAWVMSEVWAAENERLREALVEVRSHVDDLFTQGRRFTTRSAVLAFIDAALASEQDAS